MRFPSSSSGLITIATLMVVLFQLSLSTTGATSTSCSELPSSPSLQVIAGILPDPFAWYPAATPSGRVSNLSDWECHQSQLSTIIQQLELGTKPPSPSTVTSSFNVSGNSGTLNINASNNGENVSFSIDIEYPISGSGPFPAIIVYGGPSIPIPNGIATITLDNSIIAAQDDTSSRGKGLFYNLYGADSDAGAMIAWAWAVSIIIDVLEATPKINIDTAKLGMTGCSRNGKGALVAGAYDSRIALTIPQESGSGGSACWRLSDAEQGAPQNVQTASEIVQENVWFSTSFNKFANNTSLLPFDHHQLAGLIAPRALLFIDNSGYEWLGPWSSWGCNLASHTIWQALDVPDNMGFSMSSEHAHCVFPSEQQDDLDSYIGKFLLRQSTNTSIKSNYGGISFPSGQWINWTVPVLGS